MSAYVLVGWTVTLGSIAFYVAWTLISERRIAAQVLALDDASTDALTATPTVVSGLEGRS
jgi:hypothetical protein